MKTPVKAAAYHVRYIETGIDNIVNGSYPSPGCLLGYVLNGCSENIAIKINDILEKANRPDEILNNSNCEIDRLKKSYNSIHLNAFSLNHFWLEFGNSVS